MIEINLLPGAHKKKKIDFNEILKGSKNTVLYGAISVSALILIVAFIVIIMPRIQSITLNKLKIKWGKIEKDYKEVSSIKAEQEKLQQVINGIEKITGHRILWARCLNAVSDVTPKEIQLLAVTARVEKAKARQDRLLLVVSGIVPASPGERAISEFLRRLAGNVDFTKDFPVIEPPSTQTTPEGFKKFTVKCLTPEVKKEEKKKAPEKKKGAFPSKTKKAEKDENKPE